MYYANTKLLLFRDDLQKLGLNISNSTMLRWEAAGKFPKRIRVGAQSVAWLAIEIHQHIEALAAAREAA